ncbi:MAG: hypothetical protein ACXQS6_02565 [Candidatus Syntropharchaeales archaeon]
MMWILDRLKKIFELNPDKMGGMGGMGTSAKECARELGAVCDFESDLIDSAISEAMMGETVLCLHQAGWQSL